MLNEEVENEELEEGRGEGGGEGGGGGVEGGKGGGRWIRMKNLKKEEEKDEGLKG